MSRTRTIATYRWQNGRFGVNTASISRSLSDTDWLPSGYLVSAGFNDPTFYHSAVAAKAAFRLMKSYYPPEEYPLGIAA